MIGSGGIRVAAMTGGAGVPSARFRVRQYIPELAAQGISVYEAPFRFGKYPPQLRTLRPFWAAAALTEQLIVLGSLPSHDALLLQREVISKLITIERWISKPVVLDVDDAIFLFRGGYVARRLAEKAEVIVCGNSFLADWFAQFGKPVHIIPTAVDSDRYRPKQQTRESDEIVIGWIGTRGNLCELEAIEDSLAEVLSRWPTARLRVVCDRMANLPRMRGLRVEHVEWSASREVENIQSFDIGLMPLRDSPWARGKCSFKMLQYMACGLPSVVSAVGMNVEVTRLAPVASLVRRPEEWRDALGELIESRVKRQVMGRVARHIVERDFSVRVLAPRLAGVIRSVCG